MRMPPSTTVRIVREIALRASMAMLAIVACLPCMADDSDSEVSLVLRADVATASNVLRLRDVCDMNQCNEQAQSIQDIPLAPTPRGNITQTWARDDIAKVLALRGIDMANVRWSGAQAVRVVRRGTNPTPHAVVPASATSNADALDFAPAFTNPVTITQAERVVASAIESYLQLKSGASGKWTVKPEIPPRYANDLLQRRQIVSVAGGQAPWDGKQRFTILLRTVDGESVVDIDAEVQLPQMVVAAKGPLAKGRVVQETDLVWLSLPPSSKVDPNECFSDFESVVGKQLRKSISTQQPFRMKDVGNPFAVQAGDSVMIAVLAGSVRVEAYGRAIESGAMDEVIQVEVLPQRKRVAARVAGERRVEVIASGGAPAAR